MTSDGRPAAGPSGMTPFLPASRAISSVGENGHSLGDHAEGLGQRAEGRHLRADRRVVALDDDELGRRLAGDEVDLAGLPVADDAAGDGHLVGGVVQQRHGDEVLAHVEVAGREVRDPAAERLEDVVVALGLPRRVDRRGEGVDERVHVGRREVVLLVPGGGRQQDVAEQAGARHAEVDAHEQVELALRGLVAPRDVARTLALGGLGRPHRVVGAQQVLEEVLVALARRAQQVGPPDREHARPVLLGVGILDGELHLAGRQLLRHVVGGRLARRLRLVDDVERVAVELRVGRHPAGSGRLRDRVDHRLPDEATLAERRGEQVGAEPVVAPLVGLDVPEAGADHLPRRTRPVQAEGELRPAGDRAALLLADVVRPAAAVDALRSGERGQGQEGAVDRVGVEPVVGAGAHEDHRATAGVLGVLGELAPDALGHRGRDAGDLLLPGGRVGLGVVVAGRPLARQPVAPDAVLGEQQVEDGGHEALAARGRQPCGGHAPAVDAAALVVGLADVEARQEHLDVLGAAGAVQREGRIDALEVEVPLAHAGLVEAEAERAVGHVRPAGGRVDEQGLERRALGLVAEVGRRDELVRHPGAVLLLQVTQEGQVAVLLHVVDEARHLPLDEELLQDDVAHGHRQRAVGAGMRSHPLVGELGVVGVVRRHGDDLLAAVAGLGHEVRVRRARDGDVGAPHDQVGGVPPVGGLGHVGLVAEDLRRGDGQVGVPVVEGQHRAAHEADEARTGGMRGHRHGGDGREAEHAIGPVLLDRVHVRGRDDLVDLGPRCPDEAALAAGLLVGASGLGVVDDGCPRIDRVVVHLAGLAVGLEQDAAHVGVADAGGGVGVPGEGGAAGASARLVLGAVGTDARIVGLLRLPGDDAVLDVHLPRAAAGAVDAVRAADDLVVAPAVPVEDVALASAAPRDGAQVVGDGSRREEPAGPDEEVGGGGAPVLSGGHEEFLSVVSDGRDGDEIGSAQPGDAHVRPCPDVHGLEGDGLAGLLEEAPQQGGVDVADDRVGVDELRVGTVGDGDRVPERRGDGGEAEAVRARRSASSTASSGVAAMRQGGQGRLPSDRRRPGPSPGRPISLSCTVRASASAWKGDALARHRAVQPARASATLMVGRLAPDLLTGQQHVEVAANGVGVQAGLLDDVLHR